MLETNERDILFSIKNEKHSYSNTFHPSALSYPLLSEVVRTLHRRLLPLLRPPRRLH